MVASLLIYFGTTLVAMLLVPVVSRLAKRYRLVDAPGPRKVHQTPIPRVGGVAFVVATLMVVVPVFLSDSDIGRSMREAQSQYTVLLLAAAFIFAVGFIDDLRSLPGSVKLLCLVGASLAVCASGATLHSFSLGTLFEVKTGWTAWPLTVLWITGVTVCMNLIDGLDGLAAGIATIVCGTIAVLAFLSGQAAMVVLMLALLGGLTGFLFFNFHPAKIFMGDGGSMFLGFVIGASSVICQVKTSTLVGLAVPFLVLGVPIFDTGFALIRRRILERRSMFAPDRSHLHHRLLDLGLRQPTVVLVIYAITAINASIGVFMLNAHGGQVIVLLSSGLLVLFATFALLRRRRPAETLAALRRNWALAKESKGDKHIFETAETKMRNAKNLLTWWETLCEMVDEMHFASVGLWSRGDGDFTRSLVWNAPEGRFPSDKTTALSLPVRGDGTVQWEVRASIWVNGSLKHSGRQAMLLARLVDEFPPPCQEQGPTVSTSPSMSITDANQRKEEPCSDEWSYSDVQERKLHAYVAKHNWNPGGTF
jgi:UDP-GlcNAc:undecaprenyl-phosphate GlcNAc-1-phosphate transferase